MDNFKFHPAQLAFFQQFPCEVIFLGGRPCASKPVRLDMIEGTVGTRLKSGDRQSVDGHSHQRGRRG